jgi:hypothetical protein
MCRPDGAVSHVAEAVVTQRGEEGRRTWVCGLCLHPKTANEEVKLGT